MLNEMCNGCRKLGTSCQGTTEKVWNGCVYRQERFELFGGCLGNGTTVWNKAVMEWGSYKKIAHISESDRITWYIKDPVSYVPENDMKVIENWANAAKERFKENWRTLPDMVKYDRILSRFSNSWLRQQPVYETAVKCTALDEKIALLEPLYFQYA